MKTTQLIKERLNILELLSEYIDLTPQGSNYKALCPFHEEKTPSFFVSPEKGLWHCFGCGEGGDIFDFIERQEGIDFREALKILAKRAGVTLTRNRSSPEDYFQERLLKINELAAKFYQKALEVSKEGEFVREYLKKRNLEARAQKEFQLGYAPNQWRALYDFLKKRGFKDLEMVKSGLVVQAGPTKFYDRFRARLIFPLRNVYGEVVGLAGRKLEIKNSLDKNPGKYINSPETVLYHKSDFLYNLDRAKDFIRKKKFALIVEGYTDVISSFMRGIKNIVASSGTALTKGQLNLLKRYTRSLAFAYDADTAGSKATERGIELALSMNFEIKIIALPSQQDPDDLARSDYQLWKKLIKERMPVMEFYFKLYLKDKRVEDPLIKKDAAFNLLPLIKKMPDLIEQGYWLRRLAFSLGVDEEVLNEMLEKLKVQAESVQEDRREASLFKESNIGEFALAFLINYPHKIKQLKSRYLEHYPQLLSIYKILKKTYNKKMEVGKVLEEIKERDEELYHKIVKILLYLEGGSGEQGKEAIEENFQILKNRLQKFYYWRKLKEIEYRLSRVEEEGRETEAEKLGLEFQKISRIYKKL